MPVNPLFNKIIAENYENYLGPIFNDVYAQDLTRRLASHKINSILETACGTGQVTRFLREILPETRIVSTDLNPGMIEMAKKVVRENDKIEWNNANAEELPYDSSIFDAVICQFGLMFVPDKQKAVNEAYRVLKSGGRFIFNTWDSLEKNNISRMANDTVNSFFKDNPPDFFRIPFSMHNPIEIEKLLQNSGFSNITVENVLYTGYADSAADTVKALISGTPVYIAICERDEKMLPDIQQTLLKKIESEFGTELLKFSLSAWVAEGVK